MLEHGAFKQSHKAPRLWQTKNVFSSCLNLLKPMSRCRSSTSRLFHRPGVVTVNHLAVCVSEGLRKCGHPLTGGVDVPPPWRVGSCPTDTVWWGHEDTCTPVLRLLSQFIASQTTVKLSQYRCDVVLPTSHSGQPRCGVLHRLQALGQATLSENERVITCSWRSWLYTEWQTAVPWSDFVNQLSITTPRSRAQSMILTDVVRIETS